MMRSALNHHRAATSGVLDSYIRDLGNCPVLDAEEQRRLASVLRDPTRPDDEREEARRMLLESNLRFAFSLARKHQGRGVDLADLVADANLGLTRAMDHYDPEFGVPFVGYAGWWIRQAIRDGIARQSHAVSVPGRRLRDIARLKRKMHVLRGELGRAPTPAELAAAIGTSPSVTTALLRVSAGDLSLDGSTESAYPMTQPPPANDQLSRDIPCDTQGGGGAFPNDVDDARTRDALQRALDSLSSREGEIIRLSFGLSDRSAVTNDEIARLLALSPERVRQIRERALARLRSGRSGAVLQQLWMD